MNPIVTAFRRGFKTLFGLSAFIRGAHVLAMGVFVGLIAAARLSLCGFRPTERCWESIGRLFVATACHLGGAFTKIGQIASTRYDILPVPLLEQMRTIHDRVAPFDGKTAKLIVRRSFQVDLGEVFRVFEDLPIASGAIAQVHYAEDIYGKAVAVKIRRPNVQALLAVDIYLIKKVARLAARLQVLSSVPIIESVEEICELLIRQLDLRNEARLQERMRLQLLPISELHIPRVNDAFCTSDVIVMDFIPALRRIEDNAVSLRDRRHAILSILRSLYFSIFKLGLMHCDLHPGNMALEMDGRAVLLDFGICGHIGDEERKLFAELFLSVAINDSDSVARVVLLMSRGEELTHADEDCLRLEIAGVVEEAFLKKAYQFSISHFVLKLFRIQRRWGLRAKAGFTQPLLALLVFEGLIKGFFPDLDFQREALPFVFESGSALVCDKPTDAPAA